MIPILYYALLNISFLYNTIGFRIEQYMMGIQGYQFLNVSDRTRVNLIKLGWEWFKGRPWIGYGMSTFSTLYVQNGGYRALYAHNNYIELLVGTGIVGFTIYYLGYIKCIRGIFKTQDSDIKGFSIALIGSIMIIEYSLVSYMVMSILFPISVVFFLIDNTVNSPSCDHKSLS